MAAAREFWIGRRLEDARNRAAEKPAVRRRRKHRRHRKVRTRNVHRKSVVIGTIGYALLIPSIPGITLNVFLLVAAISGLAGPLSGMTNIREPVIEKVMRVEALTEEELESLTPKQQRAIESAQAAVSGITLGGAGVFRGGAVFGGIAWFVVGLVGWLLVLKGKVLECDALEEIVEASQ